MFIRAKAKKRKRARRYNGVLQHFHNFEHDKNGRTHCHSNGQHPYTIKHLNGRHIISARRAVGHGKGGKPQMFVFTRRLGDGYDMLSGRKV
ncbi:hypothetical protein LCGC14_0744780 [marine sediment metagenome]|uniref:Uncharacterized protein n=1 Tax=marine sediment metagenome TaxID=412755 RepID=A0A0F9SQR2_9ZZZZ